MSKAIYQKDWLYITLKPYVDYCTRSVYSRAVIRGAENLPKDGAVIIAPNHCNALMDAIVVLRAFPDATVFGARADIFRKPLQAKLLRFVKIVPMVRLRDGLHNVLQNYKTMEEIVDVLGHGTRFCMFNEGRHRTMRSMLPAGKGIFRIAIAAAGKLGDSKPVYVVPTGLEYGDYFRYKNTQILTYGEPINVTEFLKEHKDDGESEIYRQLRDMLAERTSELITYIKDDENYEAKWVLTKAASAGKTSDPEELLAMNKRTIAGLEDFCAREPEKAEELFRKALAFEKERLAKKISFLSFGQDSLGWKTFFKTLTAIIGLPYFIWCVVMALPMWATAEWLCKNKIKDKAFHNTARFGVKAAMSPIMIAIWAAVLFCTLPWQFATLLLFLNLASYSKFYEYKKFIRVLASDYRLLRDKELQKKFNGLKNW